MAPYGEHETTAMGVDHKDHYTRPAGNTVGQKKKSTSLRSLVFLRFLPANVLRPRQKPSPKERAGAGVNRTPLLQVTTAHAIKVDLERLHAR